MTDRRQWLGRCAVAGAWAAAGLPVAATPSPAAETLTLDSNALVLARSQLAAGDAHVRASGSALHARAARALKAPLRSVVDKSLLPPSGSRNDYMSMGPYWWPNPNTASGLPFVRRDGQRNPQVAGDALDADRMQALCADVRDLTLASYFGGDARCGAKATAAIRHWFLAPATAMTPHLRFGQSIPGVVEGRSEGLIDTRDLWLVIDAAALLRQQDAMSAGDLDGLRDWFARFVQWMQRSAIGQEEEAANNNHGMFYDAQRVNYLLFTGDATAARRCLEQVGPRRFVAQFARDGSMPLELERTRPFHYSAFNLEAATRLARYSAGLGEPTPNLWQADFDGRSLRGAIDYLAAFAERPERWDRATAVEKAPEPAKLLATLLMTRAACRTTTHDALLERLLCEDGGAADWLLWPMV